MDFSFRSGAMISAQCLKQSASGIRSGLVLWPSKRIVNLMVVYLYFGYRSDERAL